MNRFLRHLVSMQDDHLSDERMVSLLCHELSYPKRWIAERHLARCWRCRVRKEDLEGYRADRMIRLYREALENGELSLPDAPRTEFLLRLDARIHQAPTLRRGYLSGLHLTRTQIQQLSPVFATCLLLSVAAAPVLFSRSRIRVPEIDSSTLLVRAERWEGPDPGVPGGVIVQAIRITAPHQILERSIYRDVLRRRSARAVKLDAGQDHLRTRLAHAGIDWDEPISASGYRGWHDRQPMREDKIVRAAGHLLKLTTSVPGGSISEQSLTVRDTDFHPVRRTVVFRDSETVEVAELDFKILPWSQVDTNLFESAGVSESAAPTSLARALPLPHIPEVLGETQLEETELGARLILNQLHADTGEQIEITRLPRGVEVKGLVQTEERKQELQRQLHIVPHLTVAIKSVAELKDDPLSGVAANDAGDALLPDQSSPLESYLRAHGRSIVVINVLARRLFNDALTISQESKAIEDLQTRFASGEQRSVVASATLLELIYSHRERLEAALGQEREHLGEAQSTAGFDDSRPDPTSRLHDAASRNLALCKELTETDGSATQSADQILRDMSLQVKYLASGLRDTYVRSRLSDSPLKEKR